MQVRVIAVGSTKWERFIRRWGVSFLIGEDVLFDTFGDPGVFLGNMRRFNIEPAKIKYIVISHDDWDRGDRVDYHRYHLAAPPDGFEWRMIDGYYVLVNASNFKIRTVVRVH